MIFYNKKYEIAKVGETKIVTRFAWMPVPVHDKIVWLEKYDTMYVYQEFTAPTENGIGIKYRLWIEISKRIWTN